MKLLSPALGVGSGNLLFDCSVITFGEKVPRKFDFVVLKKVRDM
jgi:hypothetical protein